MNELYKIEFTPLKDFKTSLLQHQIGINFIIDSYLLIHDKYFNSDDEFNEHLTNYNPIVYFKGVDYVNGEVDDNLENKSRYNNYINDIYSNTIKLERYVPRGLGFEFTIPMIKDKYSMDGECSSNVIALFGYNYYTDEKRIGKELKCLGYLHFLQEYIPLYNTKTYDIQINVKFNYAMNVYGGTTEIVENSNNIMIKTYYNGEDAKGINIMNNIILEWGFCV